MNQVVDRQKNNSNYVDNWLIVSVVFLAKIPNVRWFQLLTCED